MADPTFDQFFSAIAGQESGGNYKAVNSRTGAAGKYQIMPANLKAWGKKYFGRPLTTSEFLASPQVQDQLARKVLGDYYNQYGARGAASAWYSGTPKKASQYTRFRSNEPSVGEYVDSVIKRAGGVSGAPTTGAAADASAALSIPNQVIDNTTKDSLIESAAGTQGDPYAYMNASIGAGTSAPGIESGTQAPQQTQLGALAQNEAASKQLAATASIPQADEGSYMKALGIGDGTTTGVRAAIVALGKTYLGTPYKWGGTAPGGFDCSGLLQYIFKKNGVTIPRVSYAQANSGKRVALGQLQAGDLVAWDNSSRNNGADHIALYIGNGQVLEAPKAGVPVRIRTVSAKEGAWGVQMNY